VRSRLILGVAALIALASLPFAVFGVAQLAHTVRRQIGGPGEVTDFLAIYSGGRLFLTDASHLYSAQTIVRLEQDLSGGSAFDRPFSFLPLAAVLLAPVAALDYGVAYLVWLCVGLVCIGLAAYLLAPRFGRRHGWLFWPLILALFLPVQFGLVMGQTSAVGLLGFAVFARFIAHQRWAGAALGLSPFSWKPQLAVPIVLGLGLARRWWTLAVLVGVPLLITVGVLIYAGPGLIQDYRAASGEMWRLVAARTWYEFSGQTIFSMFQFIFGTGELALALTIGVGALVYAAVAALWWGGLAGDSRRALQLAVLPVVGVLAAPHALVYELTTWLATAWLLLEYAESRPSIKPLVVWICLIGCAVGNVVTLTERSLGFPLATPLGLAIVALTVWLARTHSPAVSD
jgi:hypothetical protein